MGEEERFARRRRGGYKGGETEGKMEGKGLESMDRAWRGDESRAWRIGEARGA